MDENIPFDAAAVLVWLDKDRKTPPTADELNPNANLSPPHPNPEAWWRVDDAVRHAVEVSRTHDKLPWIKVGSSILDPDYIARFYKAIPKR